ncbi:hypothetical protein WUBG_00403, partial [Wuchereria bancrofti]
MLVFLLLLFLSFPPRLFDFQHLGNLRLIVASNNNWSYPWFFASCFNSSYSLSSVEGLVPTSFLISLLPNNR